jgi:hypothetical protein
MGRYDALTQLEEKPVQADPLPAVAPSPTDSSQAQAINKQDAGQKKPAKRQNCKPVCWFAGKTAKRQNRKMFCPQTREKENPQARKTVDIKKESI